MNFTLALLNCLRQFSAGKKKKKKKARKLYSLSQNLNQLKPNVQEALKGSIKLDEG